MVWSSIKSFSSSSSSCYLMRLSLSPYESTVKFLISAIIFVIVLKFLLISPMLLSTDSLSFDSFVSCIGLMSWSDLSVFYLSLIPLIKSLTWVSYAVTSFLNLVTLVSNLVLVYVHAFLRTLRVCSSPWLPRLLSVVARSFYFF